MCSFLHEHKFSFFWDKYPRVQLLGSTITCTFSFARNCHTPFISDCAIFILQNLPANAGDARDMCSIPRLRFLGVENGSPLHYSCLEKSHGQRSLAGYSAWGCRESNRTEEHVHTWAMYEGPSFSSSLPAFGVITSFNFSCSDRCSFNLHFPIG